MKQLSGLDATFLYLETPEMPMHVGALHLYELPPGFKGKFITAVRKHVAERMPATPVLRRRVWAMPLNMANPAWVDADPELSLHIVPGQCRKGASVAELEAEVARLHTQLLDRRRPLWQFHVFEQIEPGPRGERRAAMYTQLHHAAVDGQAAVALANALLDVSPTPRKLEARPSKRQKVFQLEMTEMLRGVLAGQAGKIAEIIRELPSTVGTLKNAATGVLARSTLLGGKGSGNVALAPRTPLNVSVSASRAFASVTLPLDEVRELGQAHEATVNETVLMLCSSALRRHYARKRALPRQSMIAAVPVSLRVKGDTSADNQASMSLMSLGTHVSDPLKRFAHIKAASAAMKATMGSLKNILPTDFPSLGVPWLIEAAASLYGKAKVADRIPQVANVVISNVPGPPVPLYMAGARMLTNYPTSIIVHGIALNITVQSYGQSLDFGLMADGVAMPDVADLADNLRVAFDDLVALTRPGDPDHPDTPTVATVVNRASKAMSGAMTDAGKAMTGVVSGAMGKVAKKVVGTAFDTAVAQVVGRKSTAGKGRAR